MGSIIGTILGGVASSIFGGSSSSKSLSTPPVANINAGGLTSTTDKKGNISVSSSSGRQDLVGQVAKTFPEQAKILNQLRMSVAPGMSGLRTARLQEIENARRSAVGDLRDNLQRRRVLGSSFAGDALTRSNLAFAQEKDKVQAETFMQELELTQQLTQQEFDTRRQEFTTQLNEMNLQADLAANLATAATSQMGANARTKAELDAKEAAASGTFFGKIGSDVSNAIFGGGTSSLSSAGAGIY